MNNVMQSVVGMYQGLAQQNPQANNVLQLYQSGNSTALWQFVDNACKEQGMTREQAIQRFLPGVRI